MASLASHLAASSSFSLPISSPSSWKGRSPVQTAFPSAHTCAHRRPRGPCAPLSMEIPDYLPPDWTKTKESRPVGPRLDLTAEEAVLCQLEALKNNDWPYHEHGIEVMYRFSGFDPFKLSKYFGQSLDLGQFDKFKRVFHHSSHRVMLGHNDTKVLSSLYLSEHFFKQRVCIQGAHPDDEGIFEITMIQKVGGCWDGYWVTDSVRHEGKE